MSHTCNYLNWLKEHLRVKFLLYKTNVNWFVFFCIVVFTIGSWIDLNGMWCELPIMVHELPEGWRLPTVLNAVIQLSQIGSLFFLIFKCMCPNRISLVVVIYAIFGIGIVSCFSLIFLWNSTVDTGKEKRSVGLYVLTFALGLLDGTSSLTFLPYIGSLYRKEYVIPNYIGESLSGMIPSLLGMLQGVGNELDCKKINSNYTNTSSMIYSYSVNKIINGTRVNSTVYYESIQLIPRFSVSLYFFFLFCMIFFSIAAFTLLNFTAVSKRARLMPSEPVDLTMDNFPVQRSKTEFDRVSYTSLSSLMEQHAAKVESNMNQEEFGGDPQVSERERIFLLFIGTLVSFMMYGLLPGFQSYSTLPYGKNIYHLSVNLGNLLLPVVILLSIFSYKVSTFRIVIETFLAILFSIYIIKVTASSPCPILYNSSFGSFFIVFSWIMSTCLFTRVRCCISAKLQSCGVHNLFIFGAGTIIGQVLGGLISFLIVDVYRLLKDLPTCQTAEMFCQK